jgi:hypothetical protein
MVAIIEETKGRRMETGEKVTAQQQLGNRYLRERGVQETTPRGQPRKMRACVLRPSERSSAEPVSTLHRLFGRSDIYACTVPGRRAGSRRGAGMGASIAHLHHQ